MPSQTHYLKTHHVEYIDAQADQRDGVDNPSQALQQIIDEHQEAEDV